MIHDIHVDDLESSRWYNIPAKSTRISISTHIYIYIYTYTHTYDILNMIESLISGQTNVPNILGHMPLTSMILHSA